MLMTLGFVFFQVQLIRRALFKRRLAEVKVENIANVQGNFTASCQEGCGSNLPCSGVGRGFSTTVQKHPSESKFCERGL